MAKKAGAPASDRDVPKSHNEPVPLTAEQMADLFIIHLAQARQDDDALEKVMEAVRAVKKARTRNRNAARTDGFPLKQLDEILADELLPRHDVEERESKRGMMRNTAGQPGGMATQGDLFDDSFSQQDKDEAYWRANGYTAGLRGVDQAHPEDMPPQFGQVRLEGYHDGQQALAKAWETKKALDAPVPA